MCLVAFFSDSEKLDHNSFHSYINLISVVLECLVILLSK